MDKSNENKELNDLVLIGGGLLLAYFGIIKPVLNSLNLGSTPGQDAYDAQMALPDSQNAFSQNYKLDLTDLTFPTTQFATFADDIYGSLGYLWIGEQTVLDIFSQLKNKNDVAALTYEMNYTQGVDLLPFLKKGRSFTPFDNGISKDALYTIIKRVNSLPTN